MASKDPFSIASSRSVAPIPCIKCGNNMHCIRRMPIGAGERQTFMCATCTHSIQRTVGSQASDAAVQAEAERRSGVSPRAPR